MEYLTKKEVLKMLMKGDCIEIIRDKKKKIKAHKSKIQTPCDKCETKKEAEDLLQKMIICFLEKENMNN